MRRVNIAQPDFSYEDDRPEGFRRGVVRLAPELGASRTGASVYELPPGQAICPYHYEHGEEEWLLVLEGRPTLRHAQGSDELSPWDLCFFELGPEGGHGVRNETDETARVLMLSEVRYPTVTVYPDSGKVGAYTAAGDDDLVVQRSSEVDYFEGER